MNRSDLKIGDVVRYHPVVTRPEFSLVEIVEAPWQLGSGDWICKAKKIDGGQIVRPWTEALQPKQQGDR